jgi:hypothetical protein
MPRKPRFPPEPETRPDAQRPKGAKVHRSGPAPKEERESSEAPTMPPPGKSSSRGSVRPRRSEPAGRVSDVQKVKRDMSAATVDEVTADLSKDPRREREDEDD